ncbi:unnamed protein product [Caenorhabditis angaria]|uniref:LRRCT domain-containing protein n=1 Tax=Caenorhabditis angaria TaxID=860376 RepID=A0A9P1MWG7_9PELO|nr:unnamed protein product [Caenorhabditis angaria]
MKTKIFRSLLILLFVLTIDVFANCPKVPEKCGCTMNKGLVIVNCDGITISSIVQSLGTQSIDELHVSHTNETKIDKLSLNGIRSFSIINSSVEVISDNAWERLEKSIEHISLTGNRLKSVPLFGNLKSLSTLNLNNNQISNISANSFSSLTALTQLRIEKNQISTIPSACFQSLKKSLILFDISDNLLTRIPFEVLQNSSALTYLDLSSNNISEINQNELLNLPSLREIRLYNNSLRRLHPDSFKNVVSLEYLYLQNNILTNLDGGQLKEFEKLEMLDVRNNALYTLPILKNLTTLKQLKADGNLIEKIDDLAFSNNQKLQLISLQNNRIRDISKNAFNSLDQLLVLLIGNNSISKIEHGLLNGLSNLQQLSIRNNTLTTISSTYFSQLQQLTTLDLGYNNITDIEELSFEKASKLFWLDLSNNQLSHFRKKTFTRKISNILLDGNNLICDEAFNDFLSYLVTNNIRTCLPYQSDIKCSGPEKYRNVLLKDLMMKKANDTIKEGSRLIGLNQKSDNQHSLLSSFIPQLPQFGSLGNDLASNPLPFVNTLTQAVPALRSIPGLNTPSASDSSAAPVPNKQLNRAIEDFTGPLVRFATGGQPVATDIEQLIRSIPNMVVNVPGFGDVDLSQMDPGMIKYILNGGQIPGIDKETLDKIIKQSMLNMYEAAAANLAGNPIEGQEKILLPLDKLPSEMVSTVMSGEALPGLDENQTRTIMEYYSQQLPTLGGLPAIANDSTNGNITVVQNNSGNNGGGGFNPAMFNILKMLPPGYNLNKIPKEVIMAVTRGEVPDMSLLPDDLLEHFKSNPNAMTSMFADAKEKNMTIEEILKKLPVFERPELSTFTPYDINSLTSEMVLQKQKEERHKKIRIITIISLGCVGVLTFIILIFFVCYIKKQRRLAAMRKSLICQEESPPIESNHNDEGDKSTILSGSASVIVQQQTTRRSIRRSPTYPVPSIRTQIPPLTPMYIKSTTMDNNTLESTIGRPQLSSTLLDTPKAPTNLTRNIRN